MLIDLILDRKDGDKYTVADMVECITDNDMYESLGICEAFNNGTEEDVKRILCEYIDFEYNPAIKDYINSVNWLVDD